MRMFSQGAIGNFTYLLDWQIRFVLKIVCWMSNIAIITAGQIFFVSFNQHVFLQFYHIKLLCSIVKIANFQVRLFEKLLVSSESS